MTMVVQIELDMDIATTWMQVARLKINSKGAGDTSNGGSR